MKIAPLLALCLPLLLQACAEQENVPLEARARYQSELVQPREECKHHREAIAASTSETALTGAVAEARAAHCIRPAV